ncbi:MAG: hypothetical protein HFACDABA_03050 [Anaerolineales bacterium]|nr:hypothetical protein [Anaerolineales bacterium]
MTYIFIALFFAGLEWLALWKKIRPLEFIAKPAVMAVLFVHLWVTSGLSDAGLWFGLGILCSLAGDVFLLWLDRFFLPGLIAFLFGHIAYIVGFNLPASPFTVWGIILAVMVGLGGLRVMRRILAALTVTEAPRLRAAVTLYGLVISLMLLSAMLKLTDTSWNAGASLLAASGAFLFFVSDIVLAWNKFITPIQNGRIINIGLYHLGQIALVVGVTLQYPR